MPNHEAIVRDVIAERLQGHYLYVYEAESWLVWDAVHWAPVPRAIVRNIIGDWAHGKSKQAENDKEARRWDSICSFDSQEALTSLAEGHLLRYAREFDADPLWLNCQNVAVNLVTGEVREHNPSDLFTRVTAVNYIPGATHRDWAKALTALPEELHEWMQLRFGQAITGKMTKNIIFMIGTGENGKSAILDTIKYALGANIDRGYSLTANRSILSGVSSATNAPNSALASLENVRLAVIEELEDDHRISTTALKDLADTATITARHLYQQERTFPASHSLFVTSNTKPSITDTDDGSWRRPLMVHFPYKFTVTDHPIEGIHREPDDTIKDRLREDTHALEAALAWLVEGALRYHTAEGNKRFSDIPRLVQAHTTGWRADTDQIMAYVTAFLVFDPRRAVRPDDLRNHYNQWAMSLGHHELSAQKFNGRFENHALVTAHSVERDKRVRTNTLAKVISYPPGDWSPLDTRKSKMHPVWYGFRYRTEADDERDVNTLPANPHALGRNRWA